VRWKHKNDLRDYCKLLAKLTAKFFLAQQELSERESDRGPPAKAAVAERRIEIQPAEDEDGKKR